MNLDIILILQVSSIVLTVVLAFIGIEMANNPPALSRQKWTYRIAFIAFGLLLIGVNYWQGVLNTAEQVAIKADAVKETKMIQSQYDQLQGRLNTIDQFVQHPPLGLTKDQVAGVVKNQLAEAVRTLAAVKPQSSGSPSPIPPTTPLAPLAPDTQALKDQALQTAKEINDWIASVSQSAPNPNVEQLDTYWRENFQRRALDLIGRLHAGEGLNLACRSGRSKDSAEFFYLQKLCATRIEDAAKALK